MSAAEPADPNPPVMNIPGGAAVIDITRRVGRQATTGRGQRMTPTPHTTDSTGGGSTGGTDAARALAEHFEATFNEHRLSLTDDRTAEAYKVTLRIVQNVLAGAQAHGVVDEAQRGELDQMIEGMTSAPRLIGG